MQPANDVWIDLFATVSAIFFVYLAAAILFILTGIIWRRLQIHRQGKTLHQIYQQDFQSHCPVCTQQIITWGVVSAQRHIRFFPQNRVLGGANVVALRCDHCGHLAFFTFPHQMKRKSKTAVMKLG